MNKRRTFTADEKAAIVRRHLWDKVPVSDLAQEHQVQPSKFTTGSTKPSNHSTSSSIERLADRLARAPTRKIKRSPSSRQSSHRSTK